MSSLLSFFPEVRKSRRVYLDPSCSPRKQSGRVKAPDGRRTSGPNKRGNPADACRPGFSPRREAVACGSVEEFLWKNSFAPPPLLMPFF